MMHLWISEMDYTLFNGFPQRLNADCLPLRFELNQADREFLLAPFLFIRVDTINLTLQLVSDPLCISQAPGSGLCLSIR